MSNTIHGYTISGNDVYFMSTKIPGADGNSFQSLNETWAKDRKHVYTSGSRIAKADANSFEVLNAVYAKDANHCYYLGGIIKEADATSFQVLDNGNCIREFYNGFGDLVHTQHSCEGFAGDSKNVYHHVRTIGKPCVLKKADRLSFQVLGCGYGRDQQNVYFERTRLKGADAASFEVIQPLWGKDKKSAFYGGTPLPGADPHSFTVLSSHDYLAKDATRYFNRHQEIRRDQAFPHGSNVAGYPLSWVKELAVVADYLRRGATPHDQSALNSACSAGNVELVKLLLNAGCDPRITDTLHNSCLTELYRGKYLEIAKLLVAAGADVNHLAKYSPEYHGESFNGAAQHLPLETALIRNQFDLADYLISAGANVNATTGEGYRLIDYFRQRNETSAVAYLAAKGAGGGRSEFR